MQEAENIIDNILSKALLLKDLTLKEAVILYNAPLSKLIYTANKIRYIKVPQKRVSWQIDRNVNYTNVCISGCLFCNFHCKLHQKEKSYTLTIDDYREKIETLFKNGGNQLLIQGGLHPQYDINFYRSLFKELKKEFPSLKLNALGPPEIAHIAKLSKMSYTEVLKSLMEAGLDTLPGAGAEILSQRVRDLVSPAKPSVQEWIEVAKCAHILGLNTTATMTYGFIETIEERMQHLITIRDIQKEKPKDAIGFRAFICWPMQSRGTKLWEKYGPFPEQTPADFIRMIAISRIVLNNIDHIQASWLTVGSEVAKIALHSGADDMGSIMIEENVISSTGLKNIMDREKMERTIKEAGFTPWLRDQLYNVASIL